MAETLRQDYRQAADSLNEIDMAMCRQADKLAKDPGSVTPADLQALRDIGMTDRMILDMNLVCSAFAFFVRMADGLGAELETIMDNPPEEYR